jgi:hypothetical protein
MIMEVKINQETQTEAEPSYSYLGKGLQFLIQTPLFILVGVIVIIWETINKLFQAVYQQGAQFTAEHGESAKAETSPIKIKVPMMPIDNYSQLDIEGVISRLEGLSISELGIVENFERNHENRAPVVVAIEKRLAEIH